MLPLPLKAAGATDGEGTSALEFLENVFGLKMAKGRTQAAFRLDSATSAEIRQDFTGEIDGAPAEKMRGDGLCHFLRNGQRKTLGV